MIRLQRLLICILVFSFALPSQLVLADCGNDLRVEEGTWGAELFNNFKALEDDKYESTLGAEIEGVIPKEMTYQGVAILISNAISEWAPSLSVEIKQSLTFGEPGWDVTYVRDSIPRIFQIRKDGSIRAGRRWQEIEIRSPVLRDEMDIAILERVFGTLRSEAKLKTNSTTGLHIHVGANGITSEEIALLASLFAAIQDELYRYFSVLNNRRYSAEKLNRERLPSAIREMNRLEQDRFIRNVQKSRHFGINFDAISKHGTIEFRLFNGTNNFENIRPMLDFCENIVKAVRTKDPRLLDLVKQFKDNEEIPLKDLFDSLELDLGKSPEVANRLYYEAKLKTIEHWMANKPPALRTALMLFYFLLAALAYASFLNAIRGVFH